MRACGRSTLLCGTSTGRVTAAACLPVCLSVVGCPCLFLPSVLRQAAKLLCSFREYHRRASFGLSAYYGQKLAALEDALLNAREALFSAQQDPQQQQQQQEDQQLKVHNWQVQQVQRGKVTGAWLRATELDSPLRLVQKLFAVLKGSLLLLFACSCWWQSQRQSVRLLRCASCAKKRKRCCWQQCRQWRSCGRNCRRCGGCSAAGTSRTWRSASCSCRHHPEKRRHCRR